MPLAWVCESHEAARQLLHGPCSHGDRSVVLLRSILASAWSQTSFVVPNRETGHAAARFGKTSLRERDVRNLSPSVARIIAAHVEPLGASGVHACAQGLKSGDTDV